MIQVTIFKSSEEYRGFKVSGHARYDDYGHDIICSAVSTLVINCVNSIEKFTNDDIKVEQNEKAGSIELEFTDTISSESKLLMDSFMLGIEFILEDNKKFIKLEFKEV